MFGNRLLVSVLIAVYYLPHILSAEDVENSCVGLKTCAVCTQNPECAWCSQSVSHEFLARHNALINIAVFYNKGIILLGLSRIG